MRVPLSWLREYVDLPAGETGRDIQTKLIRAGLEVEGVEQLGADLKGPLVVGQVLAIEELTEFKKPIRYCQVDVGDANGTGEPQNIVCGARNFAVGDKVVVVLPGAVLPGPFPIAARATYGKTSEGMICSARELGMGDDHDGIIVLPPEYEPGTDAIELLELVDEVLDIAVTADRGYCLSMRGVARETAIAYGLPLRDPALIDVPPANAYGPLVKVEDQFGCDRFVARSVVGVDPAAKSPIWMQRRIQKAGMRPISLAVDITNYVMIEMGQPLHAYDRHRVDGAITVRRATPGEKLRTLDGVERTLDAEDLLICDGPSGSRPIGIAGVMGGAGTEIADAVVDPETGEVNGTTEIVIEAAHFAPVSIARSARRHKLPSEAAKRFERGVDPEATKAAAQRAVDLLVLVAGGTAEAGVTDIAAPHPVHSISISADLPDRVAGQEYGRETVVRRLQEVGCTVVGSDVLVVTPPTWRPDLTDPNDLCEEVIRLEGYENLPSTLPNVPAGRGLTEAQRLRRRIGIALASAGQVEVQNYPFIGEAVLDSLGIEAGDPRRATVKIANPISHEEPSLRTTMLPGLLGALHRNVGRGNTDVALFELGRVFRVDGTAETLYQAPRLPVDRRPTEDEIAQLDAALPRQPYRVGAVFAGSRDPQGWWGKATAWTWADAVEAARTVADAAGVELTVRQDQHTPWHPGRCAALYVGEQLVGHAGELHPRVVKAMNLPERTCAMELDLDLLTEGGAAKATGPKISTFPVATQDVALVVDDAVKAADVEAALRAGAGSLLESLRLFDVYRGESLGEGRKSLAYALRFRAADRTLTADEASAARESAVAEATARVGATLRG